MAAVSTVTLPSDRVQAPKPSTKEEVIRRNAGCLRIGVPDEAATVNHYLGVSASVVAGGGSVIVDLSCMTSTTSVHIITVLAPGMVAKVRAGISGIVARVLVAGTTKSQYSAGVSRACYLGFQIMVVVSSMAIGGVTIETRNNIVLVGGLVPWCFHRIAIAEGVVPCRPHGVIKIIIRVEAAEDVRNVLCVRGEWPQRCISINRCGNRPIHIMASHAEVILDVCYP